MVRSNVKKWVLNWDTTDGSFLWYYKANDFNPNELFIDYMDARADPYNYFNVGDVEAVMYGSKKYLRMDTKHKKWQEVSNAVADRSTLYKHMRDVP